MIFFAYVCGIVLAVGAIMVLWALLHSHVAYVHKLETENARLSLAETRRMTRGE